MKSLFECVDCVSFTVPDIQKGIDFYSGALGLKVLWKTPGSCGLGMDGDDTEVVLVQANNPTVDFKVDSVEKALPAFLAAGGKLEIGPFDIDIGKCAVVSDLWSNRFCLLDMSKGKYVVNGDGDVTGVR